MGMLGWTGDNGDPDNFLHTCWVAIRPRPAAATSPSSATNRLTTWWSKAKTVSNPAERTKLYEQAQVIFKEQAPWFTIAHAVQLKPVRKEVIDFKLSPFGRHTVLWRPVADRHLQLIDVVVFEVRRPFPIA
jgi:dipeptide transport system substrate-binding protein